MKTSDYHVSKLVLLGMDESVQSDAGLTSTGGHPRPNP